MKELREIGDELWFVENDRGTMQIWYKVREVIVDVQTAYQHLAILDLYDYGRCLILDGVVQTTELDADIYNEMLAHIPVAIAKNVRDVLIIGAGACGVIKKVLEYDFIEKVDVVEIDKAVVTACLKEMPSISGGKKDERVSMYYMDGKQFISGEDVKGKYDVIIIDASDPEGPSETLFAAEFYEQAYSALKPDGILVCQSESPVFYRMLTQSVRTHLKRLFPIVETACYPMPSYPGGVWTMTLASKKYGLQDADISVLSKDASFILPDNFMSYFRIPIAIKGDLL